MTLTTRLSAADCLAGRDITEPRLGPDGSMIGVIINVPEGAFLHVLTLRENVSKRVSTLALRSGRSLGGGCFDWLPDSSGIVAVAKSGALWLIPLHGDPRLLVAPSPEQSLFAPIVSPLGDAVAYVVNQAEIHTVEIATSATRRIDRGEHDFVNDPVWWNEHLLWQSWNVPHMPWDESLLVSAEGVIAAAPDVQHQQPATDRSGTHLGWLDDRSGWLNVVTRDGERIGEDFEHGGPTWGERQRSWCFDSTGERIAFVRNEGGFGRLCVVHGATGVVSEKAKAIHGQLSWVGENLVAIRTGGKTPTQVVVYDTSQDAWTRKTLLIGPSFDWEDHPSLVEPSLLEVTARDGATLHARLYSAPQPTGRLVCMIHGGPTDQWPVSFMPRVNYWIDRGYDVLVPDHRGSTGHGRAFTQALRGRWGELDGDDVCDILRSLQRPKNMIAVLGSSAGGLTALAVAARESDLVGCVRVCFPVCDIAALDASTHRYEAHYNRSLVGDVGQTVHLSAQRSPINHAHALAQVPILIIHGDCDPVVPIDQSRALVAAVTAAGGDIELVEFVGEGHGFRNPENNHDEYQRTEAFLEKYLS